MRLRTCAGWTPVRWWRCLTVWSGAAGCAASATRATAACNGCSAPRPATACSAGRCPAPGAPKRGNWRRFPPPSSANWSPRCANWYDFEMTRDAMKRFGSIVLLTFVGGRRRRLRSSRPARRSVRAAPPRWFCRLRAATTRAGRWAPTNSPCQGPPPASTR